MPLRRTREEPGRYRTGRALLVLAAALAAASAPPSTRAQSGFGSESGSAPASSLVVAAALPATYSIAAALAAGTGIEVRLVPAGGRRMGQQPSYFERQADALVAQLRDVDAVVTIGKLWHDDPLYTVARAANLRVVDIDATKPWSTQLEGVAVAAAPATSSHWQSNPPATKPEPVPSPYFWLSPVNGARAADIVAADLMRLAPDSADAIARNLDGFRGEMLGLQTRYQLELAAIADLTVAALAPEFVYLTNALAIYVDSYFLKQDIDWTADDLAAYTRYLEDKDIRVVIHKWEPDPPIAAAVAAAGAELVVLDPIDLGIETDDGIAADSYPRLLATNLEALKMALVD
jgi:ABC-type Zn uptake system ZnuABC Zn-binding protein ZnuA